MIFLTANDQLRQRVAFALSQILVVTPNQISSDSRETEIYFQYYDIFVRHAFGNYRDILREVSYSPMVSRKKNIPTIVIIVKIFISRRNNDLFYM